MSKLKKSAFGERFKEVCRGEKAWRDFISHPVPSGGCRVVVFSVHKDAW